MPQTVNPSLQELRHETEQARAGLTRTVEEFKTSVSETASDVRQRISPESIKAEVSDYVRSRGERIVEDITAAARRNPMQAVAVGASVAYPLLRLARAIPLPVFMVGAGIFFASSKAGQSATQKASDLVSDLSDKVRQGSHNLSEQASSSLNTAKDNAADGAERAADVIATGVDQLQGSVASAGSALNSAGGRMRDGAASLGDTISTRARDLSDGITNLAGSAADATRGLTAGATTSARDVAASVKDSTLETVKELRNKASDLSDRAGKTFLDTIEQNPILVAGVGLLLGGLIASALPRSETEQTLAGEASSTTKRRTQEVASQAFETAKSAAGDIIQKVAKQAKAEGLTPDHVDASAKDIGQRIRRVAETAVTTAFTTEETQPNTGGEQNHG